ncbi:hypothetical protein HPB52_014586 [Rhipicephalus sanguineus]|uniref:HTH psq-type domain-containing protein n=1 Tax=Rhipicephalus sanguineus TaxID=34632 RepID=A0A9D4TAC8_RHISA|nr:hypothetical protein HPB52_014586 [Rhipicephalus sanguineus]
MPRRGEPFTYASSYLPLFPRCVRRPPAQPTRRAPSRACAAHHKMALATARWRASPLAHGPQSHQKEREKKRKKKGRKATWHDDAARPALHSVSMRAAAEEAEASSPSRNQRTSLKMPPVKRKAVSLDTKLQILQDSRRGFKVSALVKKYELAQSTISTILKTGSAAIAKAGTTEAADLAELWAYDTGAVLMDEFLTADCAASSCEEVTDEAIAGDVLSRQTTALSDDSSDSDNEAGSGTLAPTSMSTESALSSIDSLIDFMHSKGLPEVFAQQLESMHAAIVKLRMPRKQAKISDYLVAAWRKPPIAAFLGSMRDLGAQQTGFDRKRRCCLPGIRPENRYEMLAPERGGMDRLYLEVSDTALPFHPPDSHPRRRVVEPSDSRKLKTRCA